jgi:hypothetical protein
MKEARVTRGALMLDRGRGRNFIIEKARYPRPSYTARLFT